MDEIRKEMNAEVEDTMADTTEDSTKIDEGKVESEKLPLCVILNPREGAIWDDREKSGLYLSQFGGRDDKGNEIKNWAHIPKKGDLERVRKALKLSILLPCSPKGESTYISDGVKKGKSLDELMNNGNVRELLNLADSIDDIGFLSSMREWELSKPMQERRMVLINELSESIRKKNISGNTVVRSSVNMIVDKKTRKLVKDEVKIV